jgi:antirestriction protein ArdC/phage/plasmid primase-like uncharacterized protein
MTTERTTRKSIAEEFASQIIEELKAGTAPWQKPWEAGERTLPCNPITGTVYRGVNTVMLARHGYADPRWMTMRQANEQEWRVKRGSKAQQVVFWQWTDRQPVLDDAGKPVLKDGKEVKETVQLERPRLHVYAVFHASQLQTRDGEDIPPYEPQALSWDPLDRGEAMLRNSGATISHDQHDRAFYRLDTDEIHLPPREHFPDAGNYYSTALHELGHWTGSADRMNRTFGPHGSELYAKEELRAEIASWMLNQEFGLPHQPEQHVSYVDSWVSLLQKDPYEIMRACRDAEKIKEYILGMEQVKDQEKGEDLSAETPATSELQAEILDPDGEQRQETDSNKKHSAFIIADDSFSIVTADWGFGDLEEAVKFTDLATALEAALAIRAAQQERLEGTELFIYTVDANNDFSEKPVMRTGTLHEMALVWRLDRGPDLPLFLLEELVQHHRQEEPGKVYLAVPFKEKDQVKAAGAKWDREAKRWYAPEGLDLTQVAAWLPVKEPVSAPSLSPQEEFAQALKGAGLIVDGLPLMDGQIHRVLVANGKAGAKDGAYCGYLDGHPNGWLHNHKTGTKEKWLATGQLLSTQQKAALAKNAAEHLTERDRKLQEKQIHARKRAYARWMNAQEVTDHPYLTTKEVAGFGLKQDKFGNLLVPGIDLQSGRLQTLQRISPQGEKRFEADCPKCGAVCLITSKEQTAQPVLGEILIAEGYATGASLHQATGIPVAVAFDANNLLDAARNIRAKYPTIGITICADDDHNNTLGVNVGIDKAEEAALAVGGKVIVPMFSKEEKAKGLTDFNDLQQSRGRAAVGRSFHRSRNEGVER